MFVAERRLSGERPRPAWLPGRIGECVRKLLCGERWFYWVKRRSSLTAGPHCWIVRHSRSGSRWCRRAEGGFVDKNVSHFAYRPEMASFQTILWQSQVRSFRKRCLGWFFSRNKLHQRATPADRRVCKTGVYNLDCSARISSTSSGVRRMAARSERLQTLKTFRFRGRACSWIRPFRCGRWSGSATRRAI